MSRFLQIALLLIPALFANPTRADIKLEGWLVAREACLATRSLRDSRGLRDSLGLRLEPGRAYRLLGKNKAEASHYRIRLDPETRDDRWVPVACGEIAGDAEAAGLESAVGKSDDRADGESDDRVADGKVAARPVPLLLAVSWQAAFCETRPGVRECRSQHKGRFDASHFALHGLWPQPREKVYCGVGPDLKSTDEARRWSRLPALELSAATRAELEAVMPGAASHLHRHEWIKHGSCYGDSAETYYRDSLRIMRALNNSVVRKLFVTNVGQILESRDIRMAFDRVFGPGSGRRVRVSCVNDGRRRLISGLAINLSGPLGEGTSLAEALSAAETTAPGCSSGIVDPVGLQ